MGTEESFTPGLEQFIVEYQNLHRPGVKAGLSKPKIGDMQQSFALAMEAMAVVSDHGTRKYVKEGWATVENGISEYGNAMARHYGKEKHEVFDEEGMLHIAQTAWNAVCRLELFLREKKTDGSINIYINGKGEGK